MLKIHTLQPIVEGVSTYYRAVCFMRFAARIPLQSQPEEFSVNKLQTFLNQAWCSSESYYGNRLAEAMATIPDSLTKPDGIQSFYLLKVPEEPHAMQDKSSIPDLPAEPTWVVSLFNKTTLVVKVVVPAAIYFHASITPNKSSELLEKLILRTEFHLRTKSQSVLSYGSATLNHIFSVLAYSSEKFNRSPLIEKVCSTIRIVESTTTDYLPLTVTVKIPEWHDKPNV